MFQGELVFVKALKMKDFEMKHVLRQFIKQVRWPSAESNAKSRFFLLRFQNRCDLKTITLVFCVYCT